MAKKKDNESENHSFLFEDMSLDEIKNTIIRKWKEIKSLRAEKKDFVASAGATIKELTEQIDSLVYWVGVKETAVERESLVEAASKALEE
ncbi:MAG: hypothetical protein KAS32_27005 [Candidatus Peribacteraceae bacterium]|nr:hypothetical protein [Candidatus Peribacteraceae bacterium]